MELARESGFGSREGPARGAQSRPRPQQQRVYGWFHYLPAVGSDPKNVLSSSSRTDFQNFQFPGSSGTDGLRTEILTRKTTVDRHITGSSSGSRLVISAAIKRSPAAAWTPCEKSTWGRKSAAISPRAQTPLRPRQTRCAARPQTERVRRGQEQSTRSRNAIATARKRQTRHTAGQQRPHDRHTDRGSDAARKLIERGGNAQPRSIDAVLDGQQQRQHLETHAGASDEARGEEHPSRRLRAEHQQSSKADRHEHAARNGHDPVSQSHRRTGADHRHEDPSQKQRGQHLSRLRRASRQDDLDVERNERNRTKERESNQKHDHDRTRHHRVANQINREDRLAAPSLDHDEPGRAAQPSGRPTPSSGPCRFQEQAAACSHQQTTGSRPASPRGRASHRAMADTRARSHPGKTRLNGTLR